MKDGWADYWDKEKDTNTAGGMVKAIKQFVNHADHADEVIYIRIKIEGDKGETA